MTPRAQDIYSATLIIGAILIVWGGMAWLLVEEVSMPCVLMTIQLLPDELSPNLGDGRSQAATA